jgi:hypothetical protein
VSNPDESRTADTVEPGRLETIMLRLGYRFYETPPASDHIATCVWADLNASDESPSFLS